MTNLTAPMTLIAVAIIRIYLYMYFGNGNSIFKVGEHNARFVLRVTFAKFRAFVKANNIVSEGQCGTAGKNAVRGGTNLLH